MIRFCAKNESSWFFLISCRKEDNFYEWLLCMVLNLSCLFYMINIKMGRVFQYKNENDRPFMWNCISFWCCIGIDHLWFSFDNITIVNGSQPFLPRKWHDLPLPPQRVDSCEQEYVVLALAEQNHKQKVFILPARSHPARPHAEHGNISI